MTLFYHTVIIGGGPSGAACGIQLRKKGVRCCIIDKAVFPRDKTCGGLVTAKTFELLHSLFDQDAEAVSALFCDSVSEAALYHHNQGMGETPARSAFSHSEAGRLSSPASLRNRAGRKHLRDFAGKHSTHPDPCSYDRQMFTRALKDSLRVAGTAAPCRSFSTKKLVQAEFSEPVRFVERSSFDHALVERFLSLGGILFEGERKYRIDHARRLIFISGDRVIHYKNIVYADGVFSSSHRRFEAGDGARLAMFPHRPLRSAKFCLEEGAEAFRKRFPTAGGEARPAMFPHRPLRSAKFCLEEGAEAFRKRFPTAGDGARPAMRRQAAEDPGFTDAPADMAFCVETFLPADALDLKEIRLYFGYAENGYVWVFPHGSSICVGAGGSYLKKVNFKNVLISFLEEMGIATEGLAFHGAFCPNGSLVSQKHLPDNMLLIGDAAGFADPISGEGLYFALLSGTAAAKALLGRHPGRNYRKLVRPICSLIKDGERLQRFFYLPKVQRRFIQGATGNQLFVKYYFDQQVSHYNYGYNRMVQLYRDYKELRHREG